MCTLYTVLNCNHSTFITPTADNLDYVPETQTVTFRAGTSRACTSFQIIDDTIALEENEQFRVDFVDPSSTLMETACVTIIDDDGMD